VSQGNLPLDALDEREHCPDDERKWCADDNEPQRKQQDEEDAEPQITEGRTRLLGPRCGPRSRNVDGPDGRLDHDPQPSLRRVARHRRRLKLLDPVFRLLPHRRRVARDRALALALGARHTAVERVHQLMQVREHLLPVGLGCRWIVRLIGVHGVLRQTP